MNFSSSAEAYLKPQGTRSIMTTSPPRQNHVACGCRIAAILECTSLSRLRCSCTLGWIILGRLMFINSTQRSAAAVTVVFQREPRAQVRRDCHQAAHRRLAVLRLHLDELAREVDVAPREAGNLRVRQPRESSDRDGGEDLARARFEQRARLRDAQERIPRRELRYQLD